MLRDSGMEESRHPKIAELRKFMLNRPSKAVMAPVAEGLGALAAPLMQPFVSRDVGYLQVESGQKSRKVRNLMLQSPFKSMLARTAIFALLLALAISFVTVGLAPSATAQQANDDPCEANSDGTEVTCDYDEEGTDPVANFSAMDPEGESITWSLAGPDAADFDITGGVLSFKKSPSFESPSDREWDANGDGTTDADEGEADNNYQVMVVATEVRPPGSLELAQFNDIDVTVSVKNIEEEPTLTLDRLQVRASATADDATGGTPVTATLTDPDNATGIAYTWFVPKTNRPDLDDEDHWRPANGVLSGDGDGNRTFRPVSANAGKVLRVVATYTDGFGDENDKAYARMVHAIADPRATTDNNAPSFPAGTPTSFTVAEHAAVGTVIGTVRGADVDTSDILTHSLTATTGTVNVGKFSIDQATGRITVADKLDFETAPDATVTGRTGKDYTFTVTVRDPSGAVPADVADRISGGAITILVKVTDQNDAPGKATVGASTNTARAPKSVEGSTYTVDENHAVEDVPEDDTTTEIELRTAVVIATFGVADDPATDMDGGTSTTDGDPASTLKLTAEGPDGGLFNLTNTADFDGLDTDTIYDLMFKEEPNYESPADADGNNMYHVTIVVTDNEGASSSLPIVIMVDNVEEEGSVSFSTTQPAIGEAITATLTDPDMRIVEVVWQWGRADVPGGPFLPIQGATSDTYTPIMSVDDDPVTSENEGVDGDEGMYLEVTVKYADNASDAEDDPDATPDPLVRTRTIMEVTENAVRAAPEVNQKPVFESGITREVPETAEAGDNVGAPVKATDPDVGDDLSYTISGGADMGAFEITAANRSSGQITVKKGTMLDYEGTQTTYVVEVTARDPFGMSDSTMVTIMVTDENEEPEIALPGDPCEEVQGSDDAVTCDYDEEGMDPVTTIMAMDPEGENILWSLDGPDAEDFDITGGVLSFKKSPSYESPSDRVEDTTANTGAGDNNYVVEVIATEVRPPGSLEIAQDAQIMVTVAVKNIEEDPTLTLDRLQVRASATADDATGGTPVMATLTDPDNATGIAYTWFVPKSSRPDLENEDHWRPANGVLSGDSDGNMTFRPVSANAGKVLRVVATYTDGFGDENDKAYARMVHAIADPRDTADNNAPSFPAGTPTSFTVAEHAAVGTVVGTVRGSDVDTSDILTHTLSAATGSVNVGKFSVDQSTGVIRVADKLDFETAPDATGDRTGKDYTITVQAYDPSGAHTDGDQTDTGRTILVKVTDQNDAPGRPTRAAATDANATERAPNSVDGSSYTVTENRPVKDVDADATAIPPVEAEYAVVIATFTVADGPAQADATDPDGSTTTTDITDGDPAASLKLTAEGPDGGLFNLTDTAAAGGTAGNNTYELVFKAEPNYEVPADADGNNKYHVAIVTKDNEGASSSLPIVITVLNEDEKGEVTLSHAQPAIGEPITATLTDPDTKIVEVEWQWSRSDSPTDGYVPIQGATSDTYTPIMSVDDDPVTSENEGVDGDEGMYLQATAMYRDNAKDVKTESSAGAGDAGDKNEEMARTENAVRARPDVNEEPVFMSGITREVREDAMEDDKVGGPVTASDPDGDQLSYSISGGADMGAFKIDSGSGQIRVGKDTELDFEGSQTTYMVEVKADDPFGKYATTMVTINVTDYNEPPALMLLPGGTTQPMMGIVGGRANVSVQEGTTAVGMYEAPSDISSPSWSLSGPDRSSFSISSGGDLSFRSAPDYEAPGSADGDNVYMVTVMASGGGDMAELDVTVTVTNDPSDDQTGGGTFDALDEYDGNNNGQIDRSEVIMAIRDYFAERLSRDNVTAVIRAYFAN